MEVEVIYPYDPQEEDELQLRVGDIVTNVEYLEKGWCKGVLNNVSGAFPDNFVKGISCSRIMNTNIPEANKNTVRNESLKLPPESKSVRRMCRAAFSYMPQHDDELCLKEGDLLMVLQEVEEGWWKGILNGVVGMFPSNFVEKVDDQLINSLGSSDCTPLNGNGASNSCIPSLMGRSLNNSPFQSADSAFKSLLNPKRDSGNKEESDHNGQKSSDPDSSHSLRDAVEEKLNVNVPSSTDFQSKELAKKTSDEDVLKDETPSCKGSGPLSPPELPPKPVREMARVLYPYTAEQEDELELNEGDLVQVLCRELEDKGWWRGELNGRIGVFPDNFVQLMASPGVEETKPPRPGKMVRKSSLSTLTTNGHSNVSHNPKDKSATPPPPLPSKNIVLPPPPPTVTKKPLSPPTSAPPMPNSKNGSINGVKTHEAESLAIESESLLPHLTRARGPCNRRLPTSLRKEQKFDVTNVIADKDKCIKDSSSSLANGRPNGFSSVAMTSEECQTLVEKSSFSPHHHQQKGKKNDREPPWLKELRHSQTKKHLSAHLNTEGENVRNGNISPPTTQLEKSSLLDVPRAKERSLNNSYLANAEKTSPSVSPKPLWPTLNIDSDHFPPGDKINGPESISKSNIEERIVVLEEKFNAKIRLMEQKLEEQHGLHKRQVQLLIKDLDEERKQRACLQIEVDRLNKLIMAGIAQV